MRRINQAESEEEEEEEVSNPRAGGAFSLLAALGDGDGGDDGEWVAVEDKKKKKQPAAAAAPGAAQRHAAGASTSGRGVASAGFAQQQQRPVPLHPSRAAPAPAAVRQRPATHTSDGKPIGDDYYRAFQRVFRDARGVVAFRFHKTDIVKIWPNGDVELTTGGYKTATTHSSMNDALQQLGMRVRYVGAVGGGVWNVLDVDGSSYPYEDNMIITAKTAEDASRGADLLAAYEGTPQYGGVAQPAQAPVARTVAAAPSYRQQYAQRVGVPPPAPTPAPAAPVGNMAYRAVAQAGAAARPAAAAAPPGPSANNPRDSRAKVAELAQHLHEHLALAGDDLDEDHACIICMMRPRDTIIVPCGHMVMCGFCVEESYGGKVPECPMCRQPAASHVTIDA